jgi:hypothetical protein
MTRFVVADDRSQSTLFPERLEDYLTEDNPVRAVDVFVDFDNCVFGRGLLGQARYSTVAPQHEASFEAGVLSRWNHDASSIFDATTRS